LMWFRLRTFLLGSPLPTDRLSQTKVSVLKGLAAFSPDALSSIAYANQEIFLGLVIAGSMGLNYTFPIGLVITTVLIIVSLSYFQTIQAYPSGGGSYTVAKENLGPFAGLIAGSALLLDYVLVAAVSLSAGVDALTSAFIELEPFRITIALTLLVLITILNLRGLQETGTVMSIPVYFFVLSYFIMFAVGIYKIISGAPVPKIATEPPITQPLTTFLLIRTFAAGSTALTGIEAISNGVTAFKKPEEKHAGIALIIMTILMATLFLGTLGLTQYFSITASADETILSALSRHIFDNSFFYYIIQLSTLAVLAIAANTAFSGFPRVASFLARDRYLPFQLVALGERLVLSNGILALSVMTGIMILIFKGDSHALIPLFAIGAFLAFTLSQSGMVIHWKKIRGKNWQIKYFINLIGAVTTGIMVIVVAVSKFVHGAWITLLVIPSMLWLFYTIHRHYTLIASQLSLSGVPPELKPYPDLRLVIPVSGVSRSIVEAVNFARSISDNISAVYVEIEPNTSEVVQKKWQTWFPDIPLDIEPSPYRTILGPLLSYLDRIDEQSHDGKLAGVVIPEFVTTGFLDSLLHNQVAWLLKFALLYRRRKMGFQRIIIDVPYHIKKLSHNHK
jgi:amino acid transporter